MSFSNKDFKTVEEGLRDRDDLNLTVPGLNRDAPQSVGCEEGSKKICFCFKSNQITNLFDTCTPIKYTKYTT